MHAYDTFKQGGHWTSHNLFDKHLIGEITAFVAL
jgi:hypothetical protein